MKKELFIFGPFEEFHAFIKFNVFLSTIKDRYSKITAIVPEKAIDVISEADDIISISNEYLNAHGANYPEVLNIMSSTGRNISNFFPMALDYIKSIINNNCEILYYDIFSVSENLFPEFSKKDLGDCYRRDFGLIKSWLENGNLLYLTKEDFEKIQNKFKKYEDHYIILTRNFSAKQPDTNTSAMFPQTEEFIKYMTNKGIKILNVGFPLQHFNMDNDLYSELHDCSLSQGELIALFYLSKGVFLSGENGGFSIHVCCNTNIFCFSKEWSVNTVNISLLDARKNNDSVETLNFAEEFENKNFDLIYNAIEKVKIIKPKKFFVNKKNIIFVDKI